MFVTRSLVFYQRQLDSYLERSSQIQLLPTGACDLQAILGSDATLFARNSQSTDNGSKKEANLDRELILRQE